MMILFNGGAVVGYQVVGPNKAVVKGGTHQYADPFLPIIIATTLCSMLQAFYFV
jgi:hypothetical protein